MKSRLAKTAAALALLGTSVVTFAATNCCGDLQCCLEQLICCLQ